MIKKITHSLSILALALLASTSAFADIINFSLVNPPLFATPGSVLSFSATVSAPLTNGAAVFLNGDNNTIDTPLTLDDSGFFNGFPLSLVPGQTFTGVAFTVNVPTFATSPPPYNVYFEIDGGADANAGNVLASVSFQINVVPEPGTAGLLLGGLAAVAAMVFRRKRCI